MSVLAGVVVSSVLASCGVAGTPAPEPPFKDQRTARGTSTSSVADLVNDLLADRVGAYTRGDAAAWMAGVAPSAGRADEAAAFSAMRGLGVTDLAYGAARVDRDAYVADLSYRLSGHDAVASGVPTRWVIHEGRLHRVDMPVLPWEEPGVLAGVSGTAAVIGALDPAALRQTLATATDAVADVARIWQADAVRPVVWLPADPALFRRWTNGRDESLAVSAVTVGPVRDGRAVGADRVVVNPRVWSNLVPEGRRVVLAHETTHLALRRDLDGERPIVLEEGFCDYVAYGRTTLVESAIAAPLVRRIREVGMPGRLPVAADFRGAQRQAAYGAAWLVCRVVAERAGPAALVTFVRAARGRELDEGGVLAPLRATIGWDLAGLEAAWRRRVAAMAGITG